MVPLLAGAGAPSFVTCRYGAARATFRGPARDLSAPYAVVLGGSATLGKGIPRPYPDLVEAATGLPFANLAAPSAGPDFYLADPGALAVAGGARLAIVQLAGVETLSNPYYTVHRSRNDRFLAPTPALTALFPELDLTEVHFTRHLLSLLARIGGDRFDLVRRTLQHSWVSRMELLLDRLPSRRLFLWFADRPPGDRASELSGTAPLFVDDTMLAAIIPNRSDLVIALHKGLAPDEPALSPGLPGPAAHRDLADRLATVVAERLAGSARAALAVPG